MVAVPDQPMPSFGDDSTLISGDVDPAARLTLATAPPAAVRLMLLDRRWSEGWEFRPELLAAATGSLHELYAAAARPGGSDAAEAAVTAALLDDLDVPRALAVAAEAGGSAGRLPIRVLALG